MIIKSKPILDEIPKGAEASAVIYSIIETARANPSLLEKILTEPLISNYQDTLDKAKKLYS